MATATAPLLDTADVAALFGVGESTVRRWRDRGEGPPFVRVGGVVRYRPAAVEEWLSDREGTVAESRAERSRRSRAVARGSSRVAELSNVQRPSTRNRRTA